MNTSEIKKGTRIRILEPLDRWSTLVAGSEGTVNVSYAPMPNGENVTQIWTYFDSGQKLALLSPLDDLEYEYWNESNPKANPNPKVKEQDN